MLISRTRRRVGLGALVVAAVALPIAAHAGITIPPSPTAALTATKDSAGAAQPPTFGVPRIVDPIHMYGEPDITVAPDGAVHASGPQGTGTQRSIWNVSHDNGDSYRVVQQLPVGSPAVPNKSSIGLGGGDTEIEIGRDGTIYYDDLWALSCFTAATSKDDGATVQSSPVGCSHPPADRQWMALFDPIASDHTVSKYTGKTPLIYLSYNGLTGDATIDKTTDGLQFSNAGSYGPAADGFPVVDQHTGNVLALVHAPGRDNNHNGYALAVGTPAADGSLSFKYEKITGDLVGGYGIFFPVLVQDTDRNLYAVFSEDLDGKSPADCPGKLDYCFHVEYTWASAADGWSHWSPLRRIDQPPANTNVMAWAAAGGPGRIDVAWYGTPMRVHPSSHSNQPWYVYASQIDHANSSSPIVRQAQVSPHPSHYNDICLQGTGCIQSLGNRNLADFMQVAIDHDGRARVIYNDTSNGIIQPGIPATIDHAGGAIVTVGTQMTGRNAWTGAPLAPLESTAPVAGTDDPTGDALFKPLGGTNVPGLDITGVKLHLDGSTLHAIVTTAGSDLGSSAISGQGLVAQLVVRWQMGNDLYYAAAEAAPALGPRAYAGHSGSVDLCSVSACDPHVLTYPAPPVGGVTVPVTTTPAGSGTTYDIAVPVDAVGGVHATSLLEEVAAYGFVSATPAEVPITNAQAMLDVVPVEVEGTRTFNFRAADAAAGQPAAAGAPSSPAPATAGATVQGARSSRLPATGPASTGVRLAAWAFVFAGAGVFALSRRRPRRARV